MLLFVVAGCGVEYRENPECKGYMSFEDFRSSVKVEAPREIDNAGKIYVYGDTLLVNEKRKGIHIVDNSDKVNPKNVAFVKVLGNLDMAVKDGYLMADSFMDLVVLDINDLEHIKEVNRTINIFPYEKRYGPCDFNSDKGLVTGGYDD